MKIKTHINLKDVVKNTSHRKGEKKPNIKSDYYIEWLCRRYGLIFSFKKAGPDRSKVSFTYKHILKKINHDYVLLEQIIKYYHTISKLYQYYHPEHHSLYLNLFFIKDHLKLFLDSVEALNRLNYNVDWVTLKYLLEIGGEDYAELTGHEDSVFRKRRSEELKWREFK